MEETEEPENVGNEGWADAMQRILGTTSTARKRKSVILAKAKKDVDSKTSSTKKVVGDNEEESPELRGGIGEEQLAPQSSQIPQDLDRKANRKAWSSQGRTKPTLEEKARERALMRIATQGVVQLFNAVQQQQQNLEDDPGLTEATTPAPAPKTTKGAFLDGLKRSAPSVTLTGDLVKQRKTVDNEPIWNILREDFMLGAKMKDWDKSDGSDNDEN